MARNTNPAWRGGARQDFGSLGQNLPTEFNRPTPRTQASPRPRLSGGTPLRHRCRNPRCRMKLPAPVENEHHAFCTSGCHASFYRSRCLVCEEPMRRKNERQRFGSGHRACQAEYRRFPHVFERPRHSQLPQAILITRPSRNAHFTGLKTRVRATHRCLREWFWTDEVDCDLELRDQAGQALARLEHNRGRYRLTRPYTFPILSWPDRDLDFVKRRAESAALNALALDPATKARVDRDNAAGHPMGPPLNRQLSRETAIPSDWKSTGNGADMAGIPDVLRRRL